MIYKYRENYCYVKDKSNFYHKKNKTPVMEKTILNLIIKERIDFEGDVAKAAEELQMLKDVGIMEASLNAKPPKITGKQVYEEVKDILPYYWHCGRDGEEVMYSVSDNNEALPLLNVSSEGFLSSIRSQKDLFFLLEEAHANSAALAAKKGDVSLKDYIAVLYEELKMDVSRGLDRPPELLSWEPDVLAFKQFDPSFLAATPTPTWDEFLNRLDYPEIFLAWVWTIFTPSNMGRQALWIQGAGGDGKSRVTYALSQIFGTRQTASVSQDSFGNQFFFSSIYGKRFAIFGDCKQTRLISHSKIHSLLGGDTVAIERKGQDAFSGRVYSRLLIASNYHPEIDFNMANERSRIIQIEVSAPDAKYSHGDPNFEYKLLEEQWGFLFKCRQAYEKYCTSGMDIKLPKELTAKMELRCSSRESELLARFIDEHVELEEGAEIVKENMRQNLMEFFLRHNNKKHEFAHKDLEKRLRDWGVTDSVQKVRGHKRNVWRGVRLKKET